MGFHLLVYIAYYGINSVTDVQNFDSNFKQQPGSKRSVVGAILSLPPKVPTPLQLQAHNLLPPRTNDLCFMGANYLSKFNLPTQVRPAVRFDGDHRRPAEPMPTASRCAPIADYGRTPPKPTPT